MSINTHRSRERALFVCTYHKCTQWEPMKKALLGGRSQGRTASKATLCKGWDPQYMSYDKGGGFGSWDYASPAWSDILLHVSSVKGEGGGQAIIIHCCFDSYFINTKTTLDV